MQRRMSRFEGTDWPLKSGYHDRHRGTNRGTIRKTSLSISLQINHLRRSFSRRQPQTQGLGKSPGPFSCLKSPRHAGSRLSVLRVAISRNAGNRPLSPAEPSLFSVWPAGRRRWRSSKIKDLRARVHRQPRPPVKLQTPSRPPTGPLGRLRASRALAAKMSTMTNQKKFVCARRTHLAHDRC